MNVNHVDNKRTAFAKLRRLAGDHSSSVGERVASAYADDARWHGSHPLNVIKGAEAIAEHVWAPLLQSFPDLERRDLIFAGGSSHGRNLVGAMGHYQGTFAHDWLGIPASGGVATLRYGEVHEVVDGRISCTYALWDLLDLMRQAGCRPVAPSLGSECAWQGPATQDGLLFDEQSGGEDALEVVRAMHGALLSFDGVNLDSMDHAKYWTEHFMWYGPGGIGTTRGLTGFRRCHQAPFLKAFPDRGLTDGDDSHVFDFGDGNYVVTGGFPRMVATHSGPGWLGLPASGKRVTMRVMDFYRVENGLLAENWVPIDIVDVLHQLGVDVFERISG